MYLLSPKPAPGPLVEFLRNYGEPLPEIAVISLGGFLNFGEGFACPHCHKLLAITKWNVL